MSSSDEDIPAPTRRRRDMLKAYYGIAEEKSAQPKSAIDGKDFDAEQFAVKLLREGKLKDLLAKDVELTGEMKKLDNQLQMLVYSNYTNFITATKLISDMKTSVVGMRGSIDNLNASLTQVSSLSSSIQAELCHNRSEVERLLSVNSTLKKIDFLISLPDRLQECISIKAYSSAVTYWGVGYQILNRHQHVKSFSHVSDRCHVLMKSLYSDLYANLKESFTNDSNDTISVTIKHLRELQKTGCADDQQTDIPHLIKTMIEDRFSSNMKKGMTEVFSEDNKKDESIMSQLNKVLTDVRENTLMGLKHVDDKTESEKQALVQSLMLPAAEECVVKAGEHLLKATLAGIESLTQSAHRMLATDTDVPLLSESSSLATTVANQLSEYIIHTYKLAAYFPSGAFQIDPLFTSLSTLFSSIKGLLSFSASDLESTSLAVLSFIVQYHNFSMESVSSALRTVKGNEEFEDKLTSIVTKTTSYAATMFVKAVGVKCTNMMWDYPTKIEGFVSSEGQDLISNEIKLSMGHVEKARRGILQSLPVEKKGGKGRDGRSQTSSQSRPTSLAIIAQLEAVFHPGSTYPVVVEVADIPSVVRSLCVYLLLSLLELIRTTHIPSPSSLKQVQSDTIYLLLSMSNVCVHEDINLLTNEILTNSADRCPGGTDLQDTSEIKTVVLDYIRSTG